MPPTPRSFCILTVAACLGSAPFCDAQTAAPSPAKAKPTATPASKAAAKPAAATADAAPSVVLYVPGAYQDWKPATAPRIGSVAGNPQRFEGYVNFTGTGEQPFKFTNAPDWTHTNFGRAKSGGNTLDPDGAADGLTVPSGGYYELTADLSKFTYTATKTTWSVIGNATPGGWEKDTPMTYDPEQQVWTVTLPLKAEGSFKFRANNAWKIDFGLDANGKLQYVDNPFFDYNASIKDLTAPDDGTYTLTLDLHVPGKYTYSMVAK